MYGQVREAGRDRNKILGERKGKSTSSAEDIRKGFTEEITLEEEE